jgi:hypothetical protein
MCLQCVTRAECIGEFAPGWHIVQATIDSPDDDWFAGEYGIVRVNDPEFVVTCLKFFPEITSDNIGEYLELTERFQHESLLDAKTGHLLYNTLCEVEYPFELRRYWIKNNVIRFNEMFYTYLAWFVWKRK